MRKTIYKVRFNYDFVPYVWIRVPQFIYRKLNSADLSIDTSLQVVR